MVRKIAFYYTHYQCLGHTSRILSIIYSLKRLTRDKVKIFVFQGSLPQKFLRFPSEIKEIILPFPLYSRENFKIPLQVDFLKIRRRADFLINKIKFINPDIFITEYFPFGHRESKYELLPALHYLKARKKLIFCSLGYPFFSKKNLDEVKTLLHFYNKIFVHTPYKLELKYALRCIKSTRLRINYEAIFKTFEKKIKFTGYILPFNINGINKSGRKIREELNSKDKILILVTRGGGAYYPKIISCAILAKKYLKDAVFLISAGPSTTDKEWGIFTGLIKKYRLKNLYIKRYIPNLPDYLKESDIVISTAAYNTSVMLMYYSKKSIIIPFKGYSKNLDFWEQPARAELLKYYINSFIIDYDMLTPELLKEAVIEQLNLKFRLFHFNPFWFRGSENTAREILVA